MTLANIFGLNVRPSPLEQNRLGNETNEGRRRRGQFKPDRVRSTSAGVLMIVGRRHGAALLTVTHKTPVRTPALVASSTAGHDDGSRVDVGFEGGYEDNDGH